MTTTWTVNPRTGALVKSNSDSVKYAAMMMIPIFHRLLTTSMVASRSSGISNNLTATWLVFDLEFLKELTSVGDSEKKAASAPDTRADKISRTAMAMSAINKSRVNGFTVTSKAELINWCSGPSSNSDKE